MEGHWSNPYFWKKLLCTLKIQNSSGKWSLLLRKVKLSKDFLPMNSSKSRLKRKYHEGVLVNKLNKGRKARGIGELFQVVSGTHRIDYIIKIMSRFRWLKSNLKGVNSFTPLISWTSKTEFSFDLTKFRIFNFNVFIKFIFLSSSLRFSHASAQCRKKDDSKVLVFARKVFILSWVEDRVKYVFKLSHGIR